MAYTTDLTVPQFEGFRPTAAEKQNWQQRSFASQDCQRDSLPAQERLSVARFACGFSQLANRVFAVSPLAARRHVGTGFGNIRAARARVGQKNETPSLLIGDSMCAKNTDTANIETKAYCWYKATNGIKRHLLVDVLGNPYFVRCTRASVSDDDGLLAIIREHKQYFLDLPAGHTITMLLDNGYHKEHLEQEIRKIEPQLSEQIKIEIAEKITPQRRVAAKAEKPTKNGFAVIKKRWIVERTNAWINQCRVLWKNCEGLLRTSEAKIRICATRLILRRIA